MKTNLRFDVKNKVIIEQNETIEVRLGRLAATAAALCQPVTYWQGHFFSNQLDPYPNMNPVDAWLQFVPLCKQYEKTRPLTSAIDMLRREDHVSVAPTYVMKETTKEEITIVRGSLKDALTIEEEMARDIANVLTVMTTCEEVKVMTPEGEVVSPKIGELTLEHKKEAMLYPINAGIVRGLFPFVGPSNVTVRDGMYSDLTAPLYSMGVDADEKRARQKANIYMLMDDLASQVSDKFRVPLTKEWVDTYNANRSEGADEREHMYRFHHSRYYKFSKVFDHTRAWTTFLKVGNHTGSGKDNIFAGYSWMDMTPGMSKKMEEAMDIVNICHSFSYDAVTLNAPDIPLHQLIISSGYTVYCTTHGSKAQGPLDPVGLYYSGPRRSLVWLNNKQKRPEIKHEAINFPPPSALFGNDNFIYEYIPSQAEPDRYYLPSMKAANGLCVKTNVDVSKKYPVTIPQLIERFFMAIATRVQYIFTRITFPLVDPMSDFFMHKIFLPKLTVDDKAPDFEELAKSAEILAVDLNAARAAESKKIIPSAIVTGHRTILKEPPGSGTRVSEKQLQSELNSVLQNHNKDKNFLRKLLVQVWKGVGVEDKEMAGLINVLSKAVVLQSIARIGGFAKELAITSHGDVTIHARSKKQWASFLPKEDETKKPDIIPPPITIPASGSSPSQDPYDEGILQKTYNTDDI